MINSLRLEKDKIIEESTVKDIRNLFILKKENKALKGRVIRDIRKIFEHKEEIYYKPVREGNFWSSNYIEYESKGDRNKRLSVEDCLNKIRLYLKDISNLRKSDTCKTQLVIAINFKSSKDNDKECVMHCKNDNIEIMINDKADELLIQELFQSLLYRYQSRLEASIRDNDFIYDLFICYVLNVLR